MLILFLKSQPTEADDQVLLNEKLRRILKSVVRPNFSTRIPATGSLHTAGVS